MMNSNRTIASVCKQLLSCAAVLALTACAHPISIEAMNTVEKAASPVSMKKVAYVMTDADRGKQVTIAGGGGDSVTYYPYKDFERSLRAALSSIYSGVSVIKSATDPVVISDLGVSYVFMPEITTVSSSPSAFTWPPTKFSVTATLDVFDPAGTPVSRIRAMGTGTAEYDEFKTDFGLAGKRAVEDAARSLSEELRRATKLH